MLTKKKVVIPMLVGLAIVLGIAIVPAVRQAIPSLFLSRDERINREYASKVSISGFTKIGVSYRGNGCCPSPVLYFFGPRSEDIVSRLSAPGLEVSPPIQPSVESKVFEELAVGNFPGPEGMECSVFLRQLRTGQDPMSLVKLSSKQRQDLQSGSATLIEAGVACS